MRSATIPLLLVLTCTPARPGFAIDASGSATANLARTGAANCEPALPFFCANIHVGCAGQSAIETFAFDLSIEENRARLNPRPERIASAIPILSGPVEWADDRTYVIVWFLPTRGYLKIASDGTYSFRHYARGTAYMSHGNCR